MNTATLPAATVPQELPLHTRLVLVYSYTEIWQGTWADLRRCLKHMTATIARALAVESDTIASFPVLIEDLQAMNPQHWRKRPVFFTEPLQLRRAHYYTDQKTGSRYTHAETIYNHNYRRGGPLVASFYPGESRKPIITLEQCFGGGSDYTPEQLEALARTLLTVAGDARKYPMGPRSFFATKRGYDTHTAA